MASKLSWRKLLTHSDFISLDLSDLGMEAGPPPRTDMNMDIGGSASFSSQSMGIFSLSVTLAVPCTAGAW